MSKLSRSGKLADHSVSLSMLLLGLALAGMGGFLAIVGREVSPFFEILLGLVLIVISVRNYYRYKSDAIREYVHQADHALAFEQGYIQGVFNERQRLQQEDES